MKIQDTERGKAWEVRIGKNEGRGDSPHFELEIKWRKMDVEEKWTQKLRGWLKKYWEIKKLR